MHKNDKAVAAGRLGLVVSGEGINGLTDAEAAHIRHTRSMSPVARKMIFDMAADNVSRRQVKAVSRLKLVGAPK